MEAKCPNCQSKNVRATDNQPLDFSMKPFDPELYLTMKCEECKVDFQMVCLLTVHTVNNQPSDRRRFVCAWDNRFTEAKVQVNSLDFFSDEFGYAHSDRVIVGNMEIGDCCKMSAGHTIIRIL